MSILAVKKTSSRAPKKYLIWFIVGGWPSMNDGIDQRYASKAKAQSILARYLRKHKDERADYEIRRVGETRRGHHAA